MPHPVLRSLFLLLCSSWMLVGCPETGGFTPDEPDAGPAPDVVTLDDIGAPCFYEEGSGANPTNTCPRGLECLMTSRDGAINPAGLSLPSFEDPFSVDVDAATTQGYCTLLGNAAAPPTCPQGAILKLLRSPVAVGGFAAVCLKPCTVSAECPAGRVCDARFLDVTVAGQLAGVCVRPCFFDMPDCVLNGVTPVEQLQGGLATVLDSDAAFGGRVCARETGLCAPTVVRGTGNNGAGCATSADCAQDATCYQSELFPESDGTGFCATRCLLLDGESRGCAPGSVCQPGLLFGFQGEALTGLAGGAMFLRDTSTGTVGISNGVCFPQCAVGLDSCDAFAGTTCDAIEPAVMGAAWNDVSMCVPDEIALQQTTP